MLGAVRRAGPRSTRPAFSLLLRGAAPRPLRSRSRPRVVARLAARARAEHVAVSRADAALRRRDAGDARRGVHAARPRALARRVDRPRPPLRQGRIAQSDELVQGARPVGGDHAREVHRRDDDRAADRRQCGQRRRRVLRRRGAGVRSLHPERREAAVHRRVPPLRRSRHAGRRPHHRRRTHGRRTRRTARLVRRVDVEGAVPHRGKKTMGYEIAEQMDWTLPDWIVYPTGGGTGMVGMWKAFDEMERIGWLPPGRRPKMVSVQAEHCAPIVRAFDQGTEKAQPWEGATTIADGLRVPRAIGDFLILRAVRESGGTAVAVPDSKMVRGMLAIGKHAGVSAAPEGGAAFIAIERLAANGTIKPHESVVLFNTGGA